MFGLMRLSRMIRAVGVSLRAIPKGISKFTTAHPKKAAAVRWIANLGAWMAIDAAISGMFSSDDDLSDPLSNLSSLVSDDLVVTYVWNDFPDTAAANAVFSRASLTLLNTPGGEQLGSACMAAVAYREAGGGGTHMITVLEKTNACEIVAWMTSLNMEGNEQATSYDSEVYDLIVSMYDSSPALAGWVDFFAFYLNDLVMTLMNDNLENVLSEPEGKAQLADFLASLKKTGLGLVAVTNTDQ
jgi:hypothetical protein